MKVYVVTKWINNAMQIEKLFKTEVEAKEFCKRSSSYEWDEYELECRNDE